jgi:hypothetical protein
VCQSRTPSVEARVSPGLYTDHICSPSLTHLESVTVQLHTHSHTSYVSPHYTGPSGPPLSLREVCAYPPVASKPSTCSLALPRDWSKLNFTLNREVMRVCLRWALIAHAASASFHRSRVACRCAPRPIAIAVGSDDEEEGEDEEGDEAEEGAAAARAAAAGGAAAAAENPECKQS